jgi:hypothetical protein
MMGSTVVTVVRILATGSSIAPEGFAQRAPSGNRTGRNPLQLDSAIKETIQSTIDVQSTILDMSDLTTAGHLLCRELEVNHAETTSSASQPQAHLQAGPVE